MNLEHGPGDIEEQRLFASVHGRLFGHSEPVLVGRYSLERRLGAGTMGEVYLARDSALDRSLAIKLIHAHLAGGRAAERLRREARALAKLAHPNVVHVYEVDQHEERVYLAMEYVRGSSLREWIAEQRPAWSAVRDAYVEAGRGLAAAHTVGLVHRDFKPDNVMRRDDGRICVADFGLASVEDSLAVTISEHEEPDPGGPTLPGLLLSRTGEIKGTPAYMPPEQFAGGPVDARADQFAFCVALYEGLWGRRPFDEGSLHARRAAAMRGPTEPPERSEVPAWIWPVLARGLAYRPDDRWPSMTALLDALAAALERRRRWRRRGALGLSLGLTAAAAGFTGASLWSSAGPVERACADEQGLSAAWNDDARDELRRAFAATAAPRAEESSRRTTSALDEWATSWEQVRVEICEVRRAGGDLLWNSRQSACLEQRRSELTALLELLARADGALVGTAAAAVGELGDPRACVDDPSALVLAPAAPAAQREAVDELGRALDGVEASVRTARYAEARDAADTLAARVEATGHAPLQARLLELRGRAALWSVDVPGGVAALERAADLAEGARDDRELAETWRYLALWALVEGRDVTRGSQWLRRAEASARRLGVEPGRSGELAVLRGHHHLLLQDPRQAEQEFRVAVEDFESRGRTLRLLEARRALAASLAQQGRLDEALIPLRIALVDAERAIGPHHEIYASLAHNLGAALLGLGRIDEAQQHLRVAVSAWTGSPGEPRPDLGIAHISLAGIELAAGRHTEAAAELDRADEILRKTRPERHPDLGDLASARAAVAFARGEFPAARDALDRVIDIYGESLGPDDHYLAKVTAERGWVAIAMGRIDAAERDFLAADTVLARNPELAALRESSLRGLAVVAGSRGQNEAALELLRQVRLELCGPEVQSNYHLFRAVLHWRLGDAAEAREHLGPGRSAATEAARTGELAAMRITPAELDAIEASAGQHRPGRRSEDR